MQFSFCLNQLLSLRGHIGNLLKRSALNNVNILYGRKHLITVLDLRISLTILKKTLTLFKSNTLNNGLSAISIPDSIAFFYIKKFNIYKNLPNINLIAYSRWFGGFLTNFKTTKVFLRKVNKELMKNIDGTGKARLLRRLKRRFFSFLHFKKPPNLIFATNINKNLWIQRESDTVNIPVIALADANTTVNGCSYIIPSNYDSNILICFLSSLYISSVFIANSERRIFFRKKIITKKKIIKIKKNRIKKKVKLNFSRYFFDKKAKHV